MQIKAKSRFVRVSPSKIRPYANVVRGYTVERALSWLKTCAVQRVNPLSKLLLSAYHNAKVKNQDVAMDSLKVKLLTVDRGPIYRYYKAGPMGRASVQRKRLCHLNVVLEQVSVEK